MTFHDEMAEAYRRDYADKRRLRELQDVLRGFIADPPDGADRGTVEALVACVNLITEDMDRIVRTWD